MGTFVQVCSAGGQHGGAFQATVAGAGRGGDGLAGEFLSGIALRQREAYMHVVQNRHRIPTLTNDLSHERAPKVSVGCADIRAAWQLLDAKHQAAPPVEGLLKGCM